MTRLKMTAPRLGTAALWAVPLLAVTFACSESVNRTPAEPGKASSSAARNAAAPVPTSGTAFTAVWVQSKSGLELRGVAAGSIHDGTLQMQARASISADDFAKARSQHDRLSINALTHLVGGAVGPTGSVAGARGQGARAVGHRNQPFIVHRFRTPDGQSVPLGFLGDRRAPDAPPSALTIRTRGGVRLITEPEREWRGGVLVLTGTRATLFDSAGHRLAVLETTIENATTVADASTRSSSCRRPPAPSLLARVAGLFTPATLHAAEVRAVDDEAVACAAEMAGVAVATSVLAAQTITNYGLLVASNVAADAAVAAAAACPETGVLCPAAVAAAAASTVAFTNFVAGLVKAAGYEVTLNIASEALRTCLNKKKETIMTLFDGEDAGGPAQPAQTWCYVDVTYYEDTGEILDVSPPYGCYEA